MLRSRRPILVLVAAAALLTVASGTARADEFTAFGPGGRSVSMAGGGAALLDDTYAIYANPAGMAWGTPSVTVGFLGAMNRLSTRLSPRPSGYDAPDLGASSAIIPYRYRISPRHAESHAPGFAGFTVGGTVSLGLKWLRFGVLAFIPTSGLGRQFTYYSDEREQYFSNSLHYSIYGERLSSQQTLWAGSIRPLPWLALGGGMRLVMASQSNNDVLVPSQADNSVQHMDMRTSTGVDTAPVVSIAARVLEERLRGSITWRGRVTSSIRGSNTVQINGFQGTPQFPFSQPMASVSEHLPHQLVVATAWAEKHWKATADVTWSQWSSFRSDSDELAGFHDTFSFALGGEFVLNKNTLLRTGVGFRPSPVPDQTGRTNYVDNSMWVLGLGSAHQVAIGDQSLELALYGQLQAAMPRTTTKSFSANAPNCAPGVKTVCDELPDDTRQPTTGKPMPEAIGLQTGNPGFPGYSSGGWVAIGGVELTWRYQ
ncbi:MAG: outer membrane protein transport protein [Deltaproteobacteria bacterium]|nr:outer membrane protein transport protein [Deltaproteobacteria bacterium]